MKKIILIIILLTLFGFVHLRTNKQESRTKVEPDCEAKIATISTTLEKFESTPKTVDFSDFPEAKTYYTRITETVKRGVNFSDHYVLIPIGCGTDCVLFAMVDAKTGKVIAYNSGMANYHLVNKGSYFVLEPVHKGQTREYYKVVDDKLEMVCSEESKTNMYDSPQI